MATTGEVFPQSATTASETPWDDNDWTTPAYVVADDGNTASVTPASYDTNDYTTVLKAYNFDFSGIPAGSTIDGVICRVNSWYRSGTGSGSLNLCQLLDTSLAKVGTNQCSTPVALTTTNTTIITKGALDNKWGNALIDTWVKNSNFGVALGIIATANNADVDIDYVTLEVYYTAPAAPDALTALDIVSGTPVIEQSTIAQIHVLTSQDILSGTPVLELATLGQKHVLTSQDISSGVPVIEQATAGEGSAADELTALDITSGTPVIEQSTIGQIHALTANDITSGIPIIEQSTIGQVHALTSQDVDSGVPVIEQSSIGQIHALSSSDVLSGVPVIEQSTIGQVHGLTLADLLFGTPELEQSTIAQVHVLLSSDILSGTPIIELATLAEAESGVNELIALDITFGTPTIQLSRIRRFYKKALLRYKPNLERKSHRNGNRTNVVRYDDGSWEDR